MVTLTNFFPQLMEVAGAAGSNGFELKSWTSWELVDLEASSAWDQIVQDLAELALNPEFQQRTVSELVPAILRWSAAALDDLTVLRYIQPLSTRSANALGRGGISTWGAVADLRLTQLENIRNFGRKSEQEVLAACIRLAACAGSGSATRLSSGALRSVEPKSARRSLFFELLALGRDMRVAPPTQPSEVRDAQFEILSLILGWAVAERTATSPGQVFELAAGIAPLPPPLKVLWDKFCRTDSTALAEPQYLDPDFDALIGELLAVFLGNQRTVLETRVLSTDPPTLEEVSHIIGVTRERVRQIQVKVEQRLNQAFRVQRLAPIEWRAADLALALGCMAPSEHPSTDLAIEKALRGASAATKSLLTELVLFRAGRYISRSGWLVRTGTEPINPADLLQQCDEAGLLPAIVAVEWLASRGLAQAFCDVWLTEIGRFRRFGDTLAVWSGSVLDKCVSLLALRGSPCDADTLVGDVGEGHSVVGARSRFFQDERLVRVTRTDWALRSWGMEEYSGIVEEIAQRISEREGRVRLSELVVELSQLFQVKETSVKVYAAAPMFVLEDGWVRLRREGEPYAVPGSVASCRGVYRPSSTQLTLVIPVDQEVLRGSGRAFAGPAAEGLGVLPGGARSFSVGEHQLRVTWPVSSATGPSLGSTRELALSVGAGDGDFLRLDFDLEGLSVTPLRIDATRAADRIASLRLLTGVDDLSDPSGAIAAAIGVPPDRVLSALVSRGDEEVAELLREPGADAGLETMLAQLARRILG